jgi:hypothetical protein
MSPCRKTTNDISDFRVPIPGDARVSGERGSES